MLRLVPPFPFFVNLALAFFGVRVRPYVLAALIGTGPGTFVSASMGAGFGSVFARSGSFTVTARTNWMHGSVA